MPITGNGNLIPEQSVCERDSFNDAMLEEKVVDLVVEPFDVVLCITWTTRPVAPDARDYLQRRCITHDLRLLFRVFRWKVQIRLTRHDERRTLDTLERPLKCLVVLLCHCAPIASDPQPTALVLRYVSLTRTGIAWLSAPIAVLPGMQHVHQIVGVFRRRPRMPKLVKDLIGPIEAVVLFEAVFAIESLTEPPNRHRWCQTP